MAAQLAGGGDSCGFLILSGNLPVLRRVSHPSLPRVGLSPGNIPQGPFPDDLLLLPPPITRGTSTQKRGSALCHPPSIPKKGPPPTSPTAPPEKAFILGWDLRGWMARCPLRSQGSSREFPNYRHQQTLLFIQCSKSQREPEGATKGQPQSREPVQ